ncbi:hypothetical protein STTU_3667 [Streptomyces sp. Tu6071]|nr:hypothetical protein STTU_3667 [Streptomyces sp. Tu6071]
MVRERRGVAEVDGLLPACEEFSAAGRRRRIGLRRSGPFQQQFVPRAEALGAAFLPCHHHEQVTHVRPRSLRGHAGRGIGAQLARRLSGAGEPLVDLA